jgi:hypothetical protein
MVVLKLLTVIRWHLDRKRLGTAVLVNSENRFAVNLSAHTHLLSNSTPILLLYLLLLSRYCLCRV